MDGRGGGFVDLGVESPAIVQQMNGRARGKLLKTRRGEVPERLNGTVC